MWRRGRRENTNHTGIMIGHLRCFDNFALTSVDSFTSFMYLLKMDLATFIAFSIQNILFKLFGST